jgi:hypothetical protein
MLLKTTPASQPTGRLRFHSLTCWRTVQTAGKRQRSGFLNWSAAAGTAYLGSTVAIQIQFTLVAANSSTRTDGQTAGAVFAVRVYGRNGTSRVQSGCSENAFGWTALFSISRHEPLRFPVVLPDHSGTLLGWLEYRGRL